MVRLLAVETATEACSAAAYVDGDVVEEFRVCPNRHSHYLLPMVEQVLGKAGLAVSQCDALAFGKGPGSFTGLRIGAAVVQGLGFAADLPVVAVSSLAALAETQPTDAVLAAFDARMDQVYWGAYQRDAQGLMALLGQEAVSAPEEVEAPAEIGTCEGVGSGWDRFSARLRSALGHACAGWTAGGLPHAGAIARLAVPLLASGRAVTAELALPTYLRDRVVREPDRGASGRRGD